MSNFNHNYYGSVKHSYSTVPEYTRHEIDVYNTVRGLEAVYQTGLDYYHNTHATPHETLELSTDGGTDKRLVKVSEIEQSDFDNPQYKEYLTDIIEEIDLDSVKTVEDLEALYNELERNKEEAQQYMDNLDLTIRYL